MENKQNSTKFEPTPEHIVFAEAYVRQMCNISKAFEEIKRNRDIYYKTWRHQEGFDRWLNEYAKNEVLKRRGKWYVWLEKYAQAGSFQHLNLLMQIAKEHAPGPVIDQSKHSHFTYVWERKNGSKDSVLPSRISSADSPEQ